MPLFQYQVTTQPVVVPLDQAFPSGSWSQPPARLRLFQYQAYASVVTTQESITPDKWFAPFRDPVRLKPGLRAEGHPFLFYSESAQFPETVTESRWHQPWSEPVRFLPRAAWFTPYTTDPLSFPASKYITWFAPLSDPVRQKPAVLAGNHAPFFFHPTPVVTFSYYNWLSVPPVLAKPTVLTANQQPFFFYPNPLVSFSYYNWLSVPPVLTKPALRTGNQQPLFFHPTPVVPFSYYNWLSEPVRQKPGLETALQLSFTIDTVLIPEPFKIIEGWYTWLAEPVRQKVGLSATLQQVLAWPPRLLPTPNVTTTLATTAVVTQPIKIGVITATQAFSAIVTIKEIVPTFGEAGIYEPRPQDSTSIAEATGQEANAATTELSAPPSTSANEPTIPGARVTIYIRKPS